MFASFFKVAIRIFIRERIKTLISIFGLASGLAFGLIVFLYAHKEISYDRFHKNASRIYRIVVNGHIADNQFYHALSPSPLARTMKSEIPGVENTVRIAKFGAWLVRYGHVRNNEDNIIFADSTFFSVFTFPLLQGSAHEVLREPFSIVLSQKAAQRYFGHQNPVGKKLRIENDSTYFVVTGVMQDVPEESHMHFDMVGALCTYDKHFSQRWVANYLYTYALLAPRTDYRSVQRNLDTLAQRYVMPEYKKWLGMAADKSLPGSNQYNFVMQPLRSIHLKSDLAAEFESTGKILYIYIFAALAIAILAMSCLNFISLVTTQSVFRTREVGIRKIAGSNKSVLMRQFLLESSLLAFFSMAVALLFTELFLPPVSRFLGLQLGLHQLLNTWGIALIVAMILAIGLLSGLYPALKLSAIRPVNILHNQGNVSSRKSLIRTSLVLFQIFISVGVLSMSLLIFSQYNFLTKKFPGFDKENLLIIRRPDGLKGKLEEFKSDILKIEGVKAVTNTTSLPGSIYPRHPFFVEGQSPENNYSPAMLFTSYGFDSTFRVQLRQGRFFDPSLPSDSSACLLNETAVKFMGIKDPVGKNIHQLATKGVKSPKLNIIGVVKDFHFETLENPIQPLVILLMPGNLEGYLSVRLTGENFSTTLESIQSTWNQYTTAYPFVSYMLDSDLNARYLPVRTTGRIFILLAIVALILSNVALFGLVSFYQARRKREIGVYKLLGASTRNILIRKILSIVFLVLSASTVAWIGSYLLINRWLQDYAYHTHIHISCFIASFAVVLFTALGTAWYHSWASSRENPRLLLRDP